MCATGPRVRSLRSVLQKFLQMFGKRYVPQRLASCAVIGREQGDQKSGLQRISDTRLQLLHGAGAWLGRAAHLHFEWMNQRSGRTRDSQKRPIFAWHAWCTALREQGMTINGVPAAPCAFHGIAPGWRASPRPSAAGSGRRPDVRVETAKGGTLHVWPVRMSGIAG